MGNVDLGFFQTVIWLGLAIPAFDTWHLKAQCPARRKVASHVLQSVFREKRLPKGQTELSDCTRRRPCVNRVCACPKPVLKKRPLTPVPLTSQVERFGV